MHMKNLKRVLSLALAGTMLTGMMAIGAGAVSIGDFTDSDEIVNTEAVNTMSALGIIKGKDTGAFDPKATVTRAEMAKMITVMMNGGVEPVLGTKSTPSFTDVKGHWAESFIEYCTSNKIISGRGDGTFDPDGQVTGTEAAKMALAALGYDSTVYGFTGIDWAINVNTYANLPDANLYDGIRTIDPAQPINRDNAAQLLYNALDAYTKTLTPTTSTNGTIEWTYNNGATMMEEKFNAVKVEGVVVANEAAELGKNNTANSANRTTIEITNYEKDNPGVGEQNVYNNELTVAAATGVEELGRKVSVYVKKGTGKAKAEILGAVIVSSENTVVVSTSGDPIADVADDNKLDITDDTETYLNYGNEPDEDFEIEAGDVVTLIDNDDDGDVEIALINTYVLGYVSKYSTKDDGSITVTSAEGSLTYDDKAEVEGFEDFEREDYVIAQVYGGKLHLSAPETVTGTLEAYKGKGEEKKTSSLTVDDTKYNVSKAAIIESGSYGLVRADAYGKNENIDNEVTLYIDANGRVVAVGEVEASASQFAISWGGASGNKIDSNRVKLTTEDGTTKVYTINSKSDLKIGGDNGELFTGEDVPDDTSSVGTLVAYSLTSGGEVKLSLPEGMTAGEDDTIEFTKGKTLVSIDTGASANANTVFFYVEMTNDGDDVDSVDVYTGYASAPSVKSAAAGAIALNKAGTRAAAVAFTNSDAASGSVGDHLFLYGYGSTFSGYLEGNVVMNGADETSTIKLDDKTLGSDDDDKLYIYTVNSDGYYELTLASEKTDNYKADVQVYDVSKDTIVVATVDENGDVIEKTEYYIDSNTVVVDNTKANKTPTVTLGGGSLIEKQIVTMLVDDENALMIVITDEVLEETE